MPSFFPQKNGPECKPEWNSEAITVFSRLPSLMAADKPCLLLQPSLRGSPDCLELHNLSLHVWASYYVPFFWAFSNNIGDPKASGHPI